MPTAGIGDAAKAFEPTSEEMKEAALASLKVMGLGDHEALITAHKDKEHQHVHIVVNTVHPENRHDNPDEVLEARTLKMGGGLRDPQRASLRSARAEQRRASPARVGAFPRYKRAPYGGQSRARDASPEAPYVPVKHRADSRKQWFDRSEIIDRMKAMRAGLDAELKTARDVTWQRQSRERDDRRRLRPPAG